MKSFYDRKVTICMLLIAITLMGYFSYKQLPIEMLPNTEFPNLTIQASIQSEANPSYVESQLVVPLEGAVSAVGGVEGIETTVNNRQATIRVDFKKGTNLKLTTVKLQSRINSLLPDMPTGTRVNVQQADLTRMNNNFMSIQVRGGGGVDRLRAVVDKDVVPRLESLDGIAQVQVYGGREKSIEIQTDPDALKAMGVTAQQISSALGEYNRERTFLGFVQESDSKFFVHLDATYDDVSQIGDVQVKQGIYLKDVATIFHDYKEEDNISRVNGKDAISITLVNNSQENLLELSKRAQKRIAEVNQEMEPEDLALVIESNSADEIQENINQIVKLAVMGGLLAVIILWFFLRNLRLVFFIALSIPVSIYSAFNVFYFLGVSINSLTLIGMALAVGMLLDNSVVVLENIYRLSSMGMPPRLAVIQGTREVRKSIMAATLTTITVFLPFIFSDEALVKLLGANIGVSIISTLCFSLLVALTFIPMATGVMLEKNRGNSRMFEQISIHQRSVQSYAVLLKTSLRNPAATIVSAVVILVVALVYALGMKTNQNRQVDSDRVNVNITMPPGSTLDDTDEFVARLEAKLDSLDERKDVICRIQEEQATITVTLKENYFKNGGRSIGQITDQLNKQLNLDENVVLRINAGYNRAGSQSAAGLNQLTRFMSMLGVGDNSERILVRGSDIETMQLVANDVRYYLEQMEFIGSASVNNPNRRRELHLTFDPVTLASYNITNSNITQALNSMQRSLSTGSNLKVGSDEYEIVIVEQISELEEQARRWDRTIDDLRRVLVQDGNGGTHELQQIASFRYTRGASEIRRVNRERQLVITYTISQSEDLPKEILEGYQGEVDQLVANYEVPNGIAMQIERGDESTSEFKFLLFAALLLIYMILASVFGSFSMPFVLLFSIPLAAIGSLLGLILSGNSLLNANTLTGFLILLGVVVNNGIILIDYANTLRDRGYGRARAIMTSGLSRLRPILITTISTIVAMLPMAMGDTQYAGAIGAPFAITVIGGLAFSAMLTLILIPTVYVTLENILKWYKELKTSLHILHGAIFVAGLVYIITATNGIFLQLLYVMALTVLIPGVTYFLQKSIRLADSKIIDKEQAIEIKISNLVKIYDWDNRFVRQWNSGKEIRKRLGLHNNFHHIKEFVSILWQVAFFGFTGYMAFFYFEKNFWILFMTIVTFAGVFSIWKKFLHYWTYKTGGEGKFLRCIRRSVYWLLPLATCAYLFMRLQNKGVTVLITVLWFLGLLVKTISDHLYDNDVNIERLEGKLANFRRSLYATVKKIPLIGKRRKPFKALRGVNFEIHTGMFGLLGPNGAGKSTFMRIITGILEQSYGTITINGMDTIEYREELQSLIGFLPQEFGMYESMSAWDFLNYQAILKGVTDKKVRYERLEYVLTAVHMYEQRDSAINSFSGGMKQRIGIALILLNLPRILVVDEPTAGLDPSERIRFRNLLVELSRERIVIFSTHIIEDIASSCNQVVVINKGSLKYYGEPSEMIHLATDRVWQFEIDADKFSEIDAKLVANHMQDGRKIKVRYISKTQPCPGAELVEPNLEDAYLCLLKGI